MGKGLPYIAWYHGDFLQSTVGWSLTERAVYWMLLCAQHEQGPLPEDPARLAAIAGCDAATMTAAWNVISKKFKKTRTGLINKRMEEHKQNYQRYLQHQSDAGKKGMAKRWGKKPEAPSAEVIKLHPEKA